MFEEPDGTVGRIGYVDLDADDPARVLRVSPRPVLDIGAPGAFDENGILPTAVVPHQGKLYLYYVGYQLGQQVRYYQFQGLAVSADGGESFQRVRRTPVLERSDAEMLNRTSAFVMRDDGTNARGDFGHDGSSSISGLVRRYGRR